MRFVGLASGIGLIAISLGAAGVWATDTAEQPVRAKPGTPSSFRTAAIHPAILRPGNDAVGKPLDRLPITRNEPASAKFRQVLINDAGILIARGYGPPGSRIRLLHNDRSLAIATVGADRAWKIVPKQLLRAGDHRLTIEMATLTDPVPDIGDEVRISIPEGRAAPLKIEFEVEPDLRRHAENVGDAASRFFDNFLNSKPVTRDAGAAASGPKRSTAEESATAALVTATMDWLGASNDAYQSQIVPRLQVGGGLRLPQPGQGAAERQNVRMARLQMPTIDGVTRALQDWFGRSADNYDKEIIPRLSGARPVEIVLPGKLKAEQEEAAREEARRLEEERRRAEAARRRAEAERRRAEAENQRIEEERRRLEAEKKAEEDRLAALRLRQAEEEARKRREAEEALRRAESERERAERERLDAERARLEAERNRRAEQDADALRRARQAAEREKEEAERQRRRAAELRLEAERARAAREAEQEKAERLSKLRDAWRRARTAAERTFKRFTKRETAAGQDQGATRVAARARPPSRNPERVAAAPRRVVQLPSRRAEKTRPARTRVARATKVQRRRPRRAVKSYRRRLQRCRKWSRWRIKVPGRYVVRKGDSLWRIARRHYRYGHRYRRIYYANRRKIRNPNLIYPCQRFYIPRYRSRRRR